MIYNPFDNSDDGGGTIFRDVIMLALMGFVVIVVLLLPHINPSKLKENIDVNPPGNVIVEIRWPDILDTDVDLWVQGPGDVPVGYSNKGGVLFNLLRDDIGHQGDVSKVNYENSFSRGIVEGEYTINLHLYRDGSGSLPIEVIVVVSVKENPDATTKRILARTVELTSVGQELTVFRFDLDKDGKLDAESVHDIYIPLRSGRSVR
ncbi:hypothetical protein LCGC14_1693610 [marine sediment metagenome]|uniref:EF-hand domain-containing protein n=1 Tax=marine sediment metagenome TaxID=412755 RepID=A0A0F9K0N0_9ZZZZ